MDDPEEIANPWQVPSFDQFLFYCCPECDTKIRELNVFFKHAVKLHKRAKDVLCPNDSLTTELSGDPLAIDTKESQGDITSVDLLSFEIDMVDELKQEMSETRIVTSDLSDGEIDSVIQDRNVTKKRKLRRSSSPGVKHQKVCDQECENVVNADLISVHIKEESEEIEDNVISEESDHRLLRKTELDCKVYMFNGKKVPAKQCEYCKKYMHPKSLGNHRKLCPEFNDRLVKENELDCKEYTFNGKKVPAKQCEHCNKYLHPKSVGNHRKLCPPKQQIEVKGECCCKMYRCNKKWQVGKYCRLCSKSIHPDKYSGHYKTCRKTLNCPDCFKIVNSDSYEAHEEECLRFKEKSKAICEETQNDENTLCSECHKTIQQNSERWLVQKYKTEFKNRMKNKHDKHTVDKSKNAPKKDKFPCTVCDFIAPNPMDLELHCSDNHLTTLPNGNYSCDTCKREFSTKEKFFGHHKYVHSKRQCEVCNFADEKAKLKIHMNEVHPEYKPYQCSPCGVSYAFKEQLYLHRNRPNTLCNKMGVNENMEQNQEKTPSNPFVCETCGEIFHKLQPLLAHTKKIHGIDPTKDIGSDFVCEKCGMAFGSKYNLKQHMRYHTQMFHICVLCDKITTSKKLVQEHLSSIHNISFSSRYAKDVYPCSECGEKYDSSSSLNNHLMVQHSFSADQQCPDCEKILVSNTLLTAHKMEVHLFKPGYKAKKSETDVQCKICGKYLKNEKTLATHTLQEHEKEKHKYRCEQCDYSTYEPSRLKIHFNDVHRVAQDFKCIKCDYLTNTKKKLHQHEVTCHNINRFNLKVYMCEYCDSKQMFPKKGVFGLHLLKVHNIVTDSIHLKPGK